jgi:molecular chaperone Hsp33
MMTATAMMGTMLKGEERLSVAIDGKGPVGKIIVNANSKGEVASYIENPDVHLELNEKGKLDVKGAVGTNGNLYVTKDLGLKDLFTGQTPIVSGEIGEDFTYYFAASEQTPSAVNVGVLTNTEDDKILASGGFIIQMLPNASEETISFLEKKLGELEPISSMILKGMTPEEIIEAITDGQHEIVEKLALEFKCDCSRYKLSRAIAALGDEEITSMIDDGEDVHTNCNFCNQEYIFDREELEVIRKVLVRKQGSFKM